MTAEGRHPGAMRSIEPQMRNCASGNLEIPGLVLAHHPGMTFGHFFTLLASILMDAPSSFVENAVLTSNGFSMPR